MTKKTNKISIEKDSKTNIKKPILWRIIFLNDDFTTMDFVVEVLIEFFQKTKEEAIELMLKVHNEGRAIAGVYTKEIAITKIKQVTAFAAKEGFPLKLIMEPQK